MEQQTITMGQVTYELRRVFQGTCSLTELLAEQLARHIPAGTAEASFPEPGLSQNIPAGPPVDGGGSHGV